MKEGGGKASPYRGVVLDTPYDKPTTTLTDTSGKPFDIATQTTGKITLLFFGYTHCPDVCPMTMSDLSVALDKVPAKVRAQVEVVFVTTDPARDTPTVLRTWLDKFDSSFVGLTGTFVDIKAAADRLGVPIMAPSAGPGGSYDVDHGTQVFAYGKDGKAHLLWLGGTTTDDYAHDIERLAKAS